MFLLHVHEYIFMFLRMNVDMRLHVQAHNIYYYALHNLYINAAAASVHIMLCPSPLQLSATHHVPMVLVSVWPTTHAAVLLGTLGTRALNKVNYTAHVLYVYQMDSCHVCTYAMYIRTSIGGYL